VSAEPLRLLLADDEPLALRRIKLALEDIPDVQVVGAASDGVQAISQMRSLRPDVVLLDIKMPLANGFEVANAVEDSGGPEVIFVSAFDSYAVQAFETSAVDYLVKPVEFERLASAIGRARERRAAKDAGRRAEEMATVLEALKREADEREGPRYEKEFWIRDRGRFLRVPVADVDRIEAERDYVRLFVGLGRHAGVRPADLVGAIANEAGVKGDAIGAIEIADRFSMVEVASSDDTRVKPRELEANSIKLSF